MAFALARKDSTRGDAPPPPRMLVPLLRFNHLPERALVDVRRAVDSDAGFRGRVVDSLGSSGMAVLERGSRLFLERPEGWERELHLLGADAVEEVERSTNQRRETDATRRAAELSDALERTRAERDRVAAERSHLRGELDRLQDEVEHDAQAHREVAEALETALGERVEAVRQLKEAESLSDRRLVRQRQLEAELAESRVGDNGPQPESEPLDAPGAGGATDPGPVDTEVSPELAVAELAAELFPLVDSAAGAASALGEALQQIASKLRPPEQNEPGPATATPPRGRSSPQVPDRPPEPRRAVRLGRGLAADSVGGLDEFLQRPETFVLIDGYNVSMAGWPGLSVAEQRESLVAALAPVATRSAADIHVVFDGAYEGRRPSVGVPLPVRVHFTESGVEADDRLLEFVDDAPIDDAVVVISSDNRVRTGARSRGATSISSETLLERTRRR